MIATADRAAAAATPAVRARMHGAFTPLGQYEYLFWDGAYQQRGWPTNHRIRLSRHRHPGEGRDHSSAARAFELWFPAPPGCFMHGSNPNATNSARALRGR